VGNAAKLVGKKVKVRAERVLNGTAYATVVGTDGAGDDAVTAESEAEKPTRQPPAKKSPAKEAREKQAKPKPEAPKAEEAAAEEKPKPKKQTRRGSRGGRGRKKKATAEQPAAPADTDGAPAEPAAAPKIHLPDPDLGQEEGEAPEVADAIEDGAAAPKKKRTRRGTRGGRNRRKKPAAARVEATASNGPATDAVSDDYVPMSEWSDEFEAS
jgi:hypothetical protein